MLTNQTVCVGAQEIETLEKQHDKFDTLRSTQDTDYNSVQKEAAGLFRLRKELLAAQREDMFETLALRLYPDFAQKYPKFFHSIASCESHRLVEMEQVMLLVTGKLQEVREGQLSFSELRKGVFEETLGRKYLTR